MQGVTAISAAFVAICAACARAQTICQVTSSAAPSVATMVASPSSPETEALVVYPDCRYTKKSFTGSTQLHFPAGVERVESIPSKTTQILTLSSRLSAGFDFSAASGTVSVVAITTAAETALRNSKFPRSVDQLAIINTLVESLDTVAFPTTVQSLSISSAQLKALTRLPSTLTNLTLNSNPITELKQEHIPPVLQAFTCSSCKLSSIAGLTWPATLTQLDLTGNPINNLDQIILPPQLQKFNCENCGLTLIRGVQWPSTLTKLLLGGCKIKEFEIRDSDVAVLEKLSIFSFDASAVKEKCSDKTAQPKRIGLFKTCVISDERFGERYSQQAKSLDGSVASNSSSATESSSSSTSSSSDRSQNSDGSDANRSESGPNGLLRGSEDGSREAPSTGSQESDNLETSTASWTKIVIPVAIAVGITTLLAVFGFRILTKRRQDQDAKAFEVLSTPLTSSDRTKTTIDGSSDGVDNEEQKNDIRWDPTLAPFQIPLRQLKMGRPIARGGFGIVYTAEYKDEVVAVKRLAPDAWRDDAKLHGFMDEIRMCATLNHPKIVTFIGVAWSSLKDLSVVIEFMDGGDVHTQLHKQPVPAPPQDWFQPWSASKTIKSKALIACDVAEAVVYLHSLSPPVLHRDLKARNVLLDKHGNVKLSDFGISRELSVDETMTSEVGTVAWIAPEVLRGDRYSEKADIYSLGVLLVELDRCRHPYADGMEPVASSGSVIGSISGTGLEHKNTRIAVLVGAGQLRPAVSADSPSSVRELVARCVRWDAGERPDAAEVLEYLKELSKEETA